MATAKETREITERGVLENIRELIERVAEKGRDKVDLGDYENLYLTDSMRDELEKDGYKIRGNEISW